MTTSLYLNEDVLRDAERTLRDKTKRGFRILIGDTTYAVEIQRMQRPGDFVSPAEPAGIPSIDECAELVACLFQRMLMPSDPDRVPGIPLNYGSNSRPTPGKPGFISYGYVPPDDERADGPGPDFGAGWEKYRRHLMETAGCRVPVWAELPTEVQECFCAAVWEVMDPYLEGRGNERPEKRASVKSLAQWAEESMSAIQGGMRTREVLMEMSELPEMCRTADAMKLGVDEFYKNLKRLHAGEYTFEQLVDATRARSKTSRMALARALGQLVGKTIDGRSFTKKGSIFFTYVIGGAE